MSKHRTREDLLGLDSALDRPLAVTTFPTIQASSKKNVRLSLRGLADLVADTLKDSKEKLPWVKLGRFGDDRTDKGSLRSNANMLTFDGIEGDYDRERLSIKEAARMLHKAGVAAMLYESASSTPENPRWRVMCPCSRSLPPEDREALVARLNGVLGGVLDGASFTMSQSFYYGGIAGKPAPQIELVEGDYIDLRDDLDSGAMGKDVKRDKYKDDNGEKIDRSKEAYRLAEVLYSEGASFETFRQRLMENPVLAGWAKQKGPRQVQRAWDSAKEKCDEERARILAMFDASDNESESPKPASIRATPYEGKDPTTLPRREWLYGHYLRRTTSATIAPPGLGKSSLGVVEALAMVTGRALLTDDAPHEGPLCVWYINLEETHDELERRFGAARIHHKIKPKDIGGRLFVSGSEIEIVLAADSKSGLQMNEPMIDALKDEITRNRIDVVIVDPFISSHRIGENDNTKIDAVVKQWAKIANETGCAIDLVHHVRKAGIGQDGFSVDDARGASAFSGAVRSARVLNRMPEKTAADYGLDHHRTYFRVDDGKANYAPPNDKAKWRHIANVGLGNGSDDFNRDEDRVGVVEHWSPPDPRSGVTNDDLSRALAAISKGEWRKDVRAANWVGKAIARALHWEIDDPQQKTAIRQMISDWFKDGTLATEEREDENRKMKEFVILARRKSSRRDLLGDDDD